MPRSMSSAPNSAPASLNNAQMEAVRHLHGPCLVLAGAGSGKTRVIVHKIEQLLHSGLPAKQIAAITFTNKAAAEMRERAKALVGGRPARDLAISTFHSLGVRLLRSDGAAAGLKPQFSILDSDDVLGVVRPRRRSAPQGAAGMQASGQHERGGRQAVGEPLGKSGCGGARRRTWCRRSVFLRLSAKEKR
jgi:superfamily I DNA/RNA helicase